MDASKLFFKEPTIPKSIKDYREPISVEDLLSDLTISKLHAIFESVIKKQVDKIDPIRSKYGDIKKEEVNLDEKILFIEAYGQAHRSFLFRRLLETSTSKMEVIIIFLCVLELMKVGKLKVEQEHIFDDIIITYISESSASTKDLSANIVYE